MSTFYNNHVENKFFLQGSHSKLKKIHDFYMIPGYFSMFLNSVSTACGGLICYYMYSPKLFLRQKIWAHATKSSKISD